MTDPLKQPEIEVRYSGKELDEVCAGGGIAGDIQAVHLEKMDTNEFSLIIETRHERACLFIKSKRAPVDCYEFWHDSINRRSEAQSRRWDQLTHPQQRKRRKQS